MNSLILKILGAGFLGVVGTCGAYVGIREDIKWKNSIDYPAYYWNKYHEHDRKALNYSEEDKWEFLFNYEKFYFWFEKVVEEPKTDSKWQSDENYAFQSEVIDKVKNKITSNSTDTFLKNIDDKWESRFSGISEDWKKYRELCVVVLREYTTSNDREKESIIRENCILKPYMELEYDVYKSKKLQSQKESNYWDEYIKFKTRN